MNNNNKFCLLSLTSNSGVATVLPHCAECYPFNRRFAPVEVEEGLVYSDPSSGIFHLELGNFPKPRQKGRNLLMFELSEFARLQKKKLFCRTA